jgi:hypothetical protein
MKTEVSLAPMHEEAVKISWRKSPAASEMMFAGA